MPVSSVAANLTANRVPAAGSDAEQQHRDQQRRRAATYLTRRGYGDLLPMLGLAEDDGDTRRCANPTCGAPFASRNRRQKFCGQSCGNSNRSRTKTEPRP